jgi:hypothetical protein
MGARKGSGRATIFHKDADYRAFCDEALVDLLEARGNELIVH